MRQSIGGLVGLAAIIGLWVHTQSPPASENGASQAPASSRVSGKAAPAGDGSEPPEGPWIATQAFFASNSQNYEPAHLLLPALPAGDTDKLRQFLGLPGQNKFEIWSIVATVADPLHTRLSLFLDNQLESIERAVQAAGWDFAGQWLPWMDRVDPSEGDISGRRKQRRFQREQENFPGILIFRSAPERVAARPIFPARVLFVLLVPETPTTGINGPAFFAAMNIANAARLASQRRNEVGLLAPSFTGSFSSLTQLLVAWEKANSGGNVYKTVYGGSISGQSYADAFEDATKHEFHSGIVDSAGYRRAFNNVLSRYGIKNEQAAFFRENATGFSRGFSARGKEGEIPVYVFPRDIAHLRNAYQDAPATASRPAQQGTPRIDFSIRDPESGEDSIPIFSTVQTPLSQNSIVDSITTQLRRDGTRIVFIAATNPLDSLFLTQLVRRNSPGTRVLVGSPDVLFVAAAYREHLSGTLFLSSYPMFLQGAEWLERDAPPKDRMKFPGPNFQGIYNVTQLLVNDLGALFNEPDINNQKLRLYGYGRLGDDSRYPGLWLLTVSRSGFLPLDFPDTNVGQGLLASSPLPHRPTPLPDDAPPSNWFMTALLTTAAIFVGCILLLACNVFGWLERPLWLVVTDRVRIRLMALFGACLSLSALMWILAFPYWRAVIAGDRGFGFTTLVTGIFTLAGFIAPPLSLFLVRRKLAGQSPKSKWRQQDVVYAGNAVVLFLIVTVAWTVSCWGSTNAAFLFRFRALDLYSGASPAAPLIVLTVTFLGISLIYYKRYTNSGKIRPLLPLARVSNWPELHEPKRLGEAIENAIMAPGQLPLRDWWIRLGICGFFVFICATALAYGGPVNAFEVWHYNWALWTALVVLVFCLATGCYDLVRIWTNLSRLIDRIDLLALNSELDRVSKEWSPQPIWSFGRSVSREVLTRQMLEELREREGALSAEERTKTRQQLSDSAFANLMDGDKSPEHLTFRQQFEEDSANIAAAILEQDLQPVWSAPENNEQKKAEKFLKHSRGFVMLVLSRYFIYVVQQVRRIALCISLDLLMLILLFHSYDPQSPMVTSRFLAVLFASVGVIIFQVFAALERNHTLSRIARTNPGELSGAFWLHLIAIGGLPFLGLLAHLFPPISDFLFSWVAPNLQAMP
jgi:hypothetical protein